MRLKQFNSVEQPLLCICPERYDRFLTVSVRSWNACFGSNLRIRSLLGERPVLAPLSHSAYGRFPVL
jgi:hypothetical protein